MKFTVRWPDPAELIDRAMEKAYELIPGAAKDEVEKFERFGSLERRVVSIMDESGDEIVKINIDTFKDDEGELIAMIETLDDLQPSPLYYVYTSREAARLWGLSENTVTQWCNRRKFLPSEARKSEKTWLVTHAGMVRLTGRDIHAHSES